MVNSNMKNDQKKKGIWPATAMTTSVIILIMLIAGFLYFLRPQLIRTVSFNAVRIKNTFAYYIFQAKPHFYNLEMEKNGKDLQVSVNEALELTYRDEFVVKAVVSDDITGKYTTVNIEGLGKGGNDLVIIVAVDLLDLGVGGPLLRGDGDQFELPALQPE